MCDESVLESRPTKFVFRCKISDVQETRKNKNKNKIFHANRMYMYRQQTSNQSPKYINTEITIENNK